MDIDSGSVTLRASLAPAPAPAGPNQGRLTAPAGPNQGRLTASAGPHQGRLLVLCHGFPSGPKGAALSGHTYPQLAQRLSVEAGWSVLAFNFRGTGDSTGDFSLAGWRDDIRSVLEHCADTDLAPDGIWLAGFDLGGSLALCVAGGDDQVRGVASFAAPAEFGSLNLDSRFLERARGLGVITTKGFPADEEAWTKELEAIRPLDELARIGPRPVLIVHGSEDERLPVLDARLLADAAGPGAELRVLTGAGHRLRHDPRAVAVLLGWLDRQA